ncbi:MAG: hypothetical protein ACYS8X_06670 [Planctomycetota bacterium]
MSMFPGYYAIRADQDAADAAARGSVSSRRAAEAATNVRELESRLDNLLLTCMAMWSLLKEKTDLTQEELLARVEKLDLADGVADGKLQTAPVECPQCGRTMAKRHKSCMYCGAKKLNASAFDGSL